MIKRVVHHKLKRVGTMPQEPVAVDNDYQYNLQRGVSYSKLQSFLSCRQRCAYECQGWRRIESKESLTFGGMFHELLEQLYTFIRDEKIPYGALCKQIEEISEPWIDQICSTAMKGGANGEMVERCAALAAGLLPGYVKYHKDDHKKVWVSLESEFKQTWQGHTLFGYRDGVFEQDKKQLWILETKTKSQISKDLGDVVSFDAQNLYYALATELETKRTVVGVLYNVIRKPGWKMDGVDATEIKKRALEESMKDPKHFYVRYPTRISRVHLERYKVELKMKLDDFTAWLHGKLPTYRSEGACTGIWNCQFIQVCSTGSFIGFKKEDRK